MVQETKEMVPVQGRSHIDGYPLAERAARLLTGVLGATTAPLRVGIDACDIIRLRRQLQSASGTRFLTNSFTERELDYCADRAERIAARWAAKEAVAKAVGSGFRGLRPAQIEICRHRDGAPYVQCVGDMPWPRDAHTWLWSISMGHEGDLAIAAAIGILSAATTVAEPDSADTKGSPR